MKTIIDSLPTISKKAAEALKNFDTDKFVRYNKLLQRAVVKYGQRTHIGYCAPGYGHMSVKTYKWSLNGFTFTGTAQDSYKLSRS